MMQTRYIVLVPCMHTLLMHPQAIMLDPLSPWGYEARHAALHEAGDYYNAVHAFEAMLSMIEQSPDPAIHREYDAPLL